MINIPTDFMESLPYLEVTSINMINFKTPGSLTIKLSDYTEIIGDNGAGKTTILDAIAFCFKGKDSFGNKIDFITKGQDMATVTLFLSNGSGTIHKLTRTAKVTPAGNISTSVTFDYQKIKDKDLNELFNEDLTLSILNPTYFTDLSPIKGRGLLAAVMDVSVEATFKKNRSDLAFTRREREILDSVISGQTNIEDILKLESKMKDELKDLLKDVEELMYEIAILKSATVEEIAKVRGIKEEIELMELDEKSKNLLTKIIESNFTQIDRQVDISEKGKILKETRIAAEIKKKQIYFAREFFKRYLLDIEVKANSALKNTSVELINVLEKEDKVSGEKVIEYKEVFKVYHKGLHIKNCSMSERIRACIEIADTLCSQTGISLPTFIDNAESIGDIEMPIFLNQLVSLTFHKDLPLSFIEKDKVVNLETGTTMPRPDPTKEPIRRILASFF